MIVFKPFYNALLRDKPWGTVIASPAYQAYRLRVVRATNPVIPRRDSTRVRRFLEILAILNGE